MIGNGFAETGEAYRNGNYEPLDDVCEIAEGEATDFVYDADGNEIRKGDWVEILDDNVWNRKGQIAEVTAIQRGEVYGSHGGAMRHTGRGKWSPSNSLNGVSLLFDRVTSTGCRWHQARRVNLTEEETLRLELRALLLEKSRLIEQEARLTANMMTLDRRIANVREKLS